jgi:hypothetical protein
MTVTQERSSRNSASAATIGPTITLENPHRISNDFNRGRSSSAADAISNAPVVENGDQSTIEAHTPIEMINAHHLTAQTE